MPRFTVKHLLILTTVVAISLGVWVSLPYDVRDIIFLAILPVALFLVVMHFLLGWAIWVLDSTKKITRPRKEMSDESSVSD